MMSGGEKTGLMHHFSGLEDPRRPQGRRHNLLDIIAMTICAVVAGAEDWDDVEWSSYVSPAGTRPSSLERSLS